MKAGTRMMMISSLGDDERRIGFRSGQEEMRGGWENRYDEPEGAYEPRSRYDERRSPDSYGPESRDDYEERIPPMNYRSPHSSGPWSGGREMNGGARRVGEPNARKYRADIRGSGEPEGRYEQRPQSHYGGEKGGDDLSGTFRHRKAEGHIPEEEDEELTEERVRAWTDGMKNNDGTTGAHFKMDQVELMRASYCPQCDKLEFFGAVNMMYSDYCDVAKRMNIDRAEFYASMAKAFLMDKDAGEGKMAKYIKYIAGK